MTSFLFVILKFYSNQSKCNYLKNKKEILKFLLHIQNLHQSLKILQKRWPS